MKDPRDIILAPVVSEKSYALMETGVYTFKVRPSASKPEIRDAVESIWDVEVDKRQHAEPQGQASPHPRHQPGRLEARREARHRHALGGRDPAVRELRSSWVSAHANQRAPVAASRPSRTSPRSPSQAPGEVAARPQAEDRRAQRPRPQDVAPPRRRPQAAVPHHRLQAQQGRRHGQGRGDRVRPEPHVPHRPAALRRRHEGVHPRPRGPDGRRPRDERPGRRHQAGQRPADALHPRRHHASTTSRCAPARAARSAAPRASPCSSSPRTATSPRCACRPPRCAACRSTAAPRSARSATPSTSSIKVGKAGRNRWKGVRPQTRGVAMNPVDHPLGGGEGRTSGGRPAVSPWGKPEGRTRDKTKPSQSLIIRRRRTGKGRR